MSDDESRTTIPQCTECERIRPVLVAGSVAECDACGSTLRAPEAAAVARRSAPSVELELLARWLPVLEGRAVGIEPTIASSGPRQDRCDERTQEWHRALTVHRRFESLRVGIGCTHYAVLHWLFLARGAECRVRWAGLLEELGWAFATQEQRTRWNEARRSVKSAGPRKLGERLYDAALAAYEASK